MNSIIKYQTDFHDIMIKKHFAETGKKVRISVPAFCEYGRESHARIAAPYRSARREDMNTQVSEKNGVRFVEGVKGYTLLSSEKDAVELAGLCGSNGTNRVLLYADNLSEGFYDLKTTIAGNALQKLINYRIRAAAIIPEEKIGNGRFFEMVVESNRGNDFRVFQDREKAVDWLVSR